MFWLPLTLALAAAPNALAQAGAATSGPSRPLVDFEAMTEAMKDPAPGGNLASSAAYAHFLKARLAHHAGDPARAADELQLALASAGQDKCLRTHLAEEYARMGDLARAERELLDVVAHHPKYGPALLLLGRVLVEDHQGTRAKVFLNRAIKVDKKNPDAYMLLAQLGLELNKVEEALAAVNSLTAATGDPAGLKRLGEVLSEKGDAAHAESLLERATRMDPQDAEAWFSYAQVEDALGKDGVSEAAYARALEREPDNQEALLNAGGVALKLHALTNAKAYFDRLLSHADDAETVVKVALSYWAAGQLEQAAQVLDDARKSGVDEPRLSYYAGLAHQKAGNYGKAAEAFAQVMHDSELAREATVRLGETLARAGRYQEAVGLLSGAAQATPDHFELYPTLAQVMEQSGDVTGAEAMLRKTLTKVAASEVYEALAELLERHNRTKEAILLLQGALTKKPSDELLHFSLAAAYERVGELDLSLLQMRQVLALDPNNAAAMNFIGYTLAEKGEGYEEAERLLVRANQLKPDTGAFLDSLGWLYLRRGDLRRAVGTLERAAQLSPDEPVIIEHLGDAYRGIERNGQAAAAYRRALDALGGSRDALGMTQRRGLEEKLKLLSPEAQAR